jgi:hypothetical protein
MILDFIDGLSPKTVRILERSVEYGYWGYGVGTPFYAFVYSGSFWALLWALAIGNLMARGAFSKKEARP